MTVEVPWSFGAVTLTVPFDSVWVVFEVQVPGCSVYAYVVLALIPVGSCVTVATRPSTGSYVMSVTRPVGLVIFETRFEVS